MKCLVIFEKDLEYFFAPPRQPQFEEQLSLSPWRDGHKKSLQILQAPTLFLPHTQKITQVNNI